MLIPTREAAASVAWGGGKCNAGSLPSSNSTYRRNVGKETKRDTVVVDMGAPSERTVNWLAKYVMNVPK
jgi:hypothetical protein